MTRDERILANKGLVYFIANRVMKRWFSRLDWDDLLQAGYVGLILAVDRFDPEREVKFSTFAYRYIWGGMMQCVYKERSPMPSERQQEAYRNGDDVPRVVTRSFHDPHHLNRASDTESIVKRVVREQLTEQQRMLVDRNQEYVAPPEDCLPSTLGLRERVVLTMRFWQCLSLREVGKKLGVSVERVRELERRALYTLEELYSC